MVERRFAGDKVYKSVFSRIVEKAGATQETVSVAAGYSKSWIGGRFMRGGQEYGVFRKSELESICKTLDCTIEELTAVPAEKVEENKEQKEVLDDAKLEKLHEMIKQGFQMVHSDIMALLEYVQRIAKELE